MQSPNRNLAQGNASTLLERSLILNKKRHKIKDSLFWFTINAVILLILMYDLSQTCSMYFNYYHYIEYSLVIIFTLNVLFYFAKIARLYFSSKDQISITMEQKKLLGVKDSDPNYKIVTPGKKDLNATSVSPTVNTSLNASHLSWRSGISHNESMSVNYSMPSPSWIYHKGTPEMNQSQYANLSNRRTPKSPHSPLSSYHNVSSIENIDDESSLNQYLKEHEEVEKVNKMANKSHNSANLLSSFWSHPITKSAKDMSTFLKKSQYQLSSQSPGSSPSSKPEDKSGGNVPALEVWTRINVDTVALTQWNENLRIWISQTILERLVKEFDVINDSLEKHGMTDIRIGGVGLDRLRKTAQMSQIIQFIPSLSTILPFLELHANQDYLVKRIRELSRGGCMSEFRWNAGGHYNSKEWDASLPTDCSIVMHLLASYLDTQLMPSPNMPDTKAFSSQYCIRAIDKVPVLTDRSLFIQEVTEKPPHYRVVVGKKIYEMVKGYNNLFHSILFFIYHVNKLEQGMLGRVNLGRAGVNMLWIIGQNE
ncbi:transmembrane protein 209 [Rhynchophorus ferrugineus]|uniref:transmembrane protein 209 n=1 Tax=Rhynchophorus ferrugineus TaxID=354439 RepID=UPI003FCD4809